MGCGNDVVVCGSDGLACGNDVVVRGVYEELTLFSRVCHNSAIGAFGVSIQCEEGVSCQLLKWYGWRI